MLQAMIEFSNTAFAVVTVPTINANTTTSGTSTTTTMTTTTTAAASSPSDDVVVVSQVNNDLSASTSSGFAYYRISAVSALCVCDRNVACAADCRYCAQVGNTSFSVCSLKVTSMWRFDVSHSSDAVCACGRAAANTCACCELARQCVHARYRDRVVVTRVVVAQVFSSAVQDFRNLGTAALAGLLVAGTHMRR
jgi:hypothetical protein